jgi:hypothetical protein
MAEWKKVIVSGSNVSQLNNDAGYLTAGTLGIPNGFSTASFNGTNLLADSPTGSLNFASGSGQGLTITADSGTDTLTFGLSAIPNTSLANSTISGKALGTSLDDLTIGNGLAASSNYNGSAARTVAVGAGTHITVNTDDVAVNTTTLVPAISGSIFSQVSGDVLINTAGVATIQANSVALGTDTTGDYVANLGTGTGITIGSNTGEGSQPTIAVNYGSTSNTAVQGNTNITINGTANEVEITGTAAQALGGAPSYTIGLPNDVTIGNNLTVTNNLTVLGTASFQNTTNLEVADRFVLFASGSNANGDGGIVVQQDTQNVGELFGYDSGTTRWGLTGSFTADGASFTPDAFMAAVTTLASTDPNSSGPASRYEAVGNIYVSSGDESIWIYA